MIHTRYMASVRIERVGARVPGLTRQLIVPRFWDAVVTEEQGVPGRIRLKVVYDPALRRMAASSIAVEREGEGSEVTSLTLREVRVQSAVQQSGLIAVKVASGNAHVSAAEFLRAVRQDETPITKARSAAVIYQVAALINLPPLKTVADALRVSQSTATRMVNQARAAGLIDELVQGVPANQSRQPVKTGEQTSASR